MEGPLVGCESSLPEVGEVSVQSATGTQSTVPDDVARSLEQRRRKLLLRSAIPVLLSGIVICWIAIVVRNRQYSTEAAQQFEKNIAGLIAVFEESGTLPLSYPPQDTEGVSADLPNFNYIDAAEILRLRDLPDDLLVAYSNLIRQVFRSDTRMIALRSGSKIQVKAVSANEFEQLRHRQADRLQADGQSRNPNKIH